MNGRINSWWRLISKPSYAKEIEEAVNTLLPHAGYNFFKSGSQTAVSFRKEKTTLTRPRQPVWERKPAESGSAPVCLGERKGMYQKSILENGIRVVTESMPKHRSISMGILIDASPRNEAPDEGGLAHLVEHVLFCGTSSRNATQIARLMDEAGGHMGAFTARDFTCYSATVLDDYFTYALDLLGDILLNSIFPPDSLEKEKSAILREIETTGDMPDERVHNLLKAYAWPDHSLGRSIAGQPETVRTLTRENVIYFVHENYLPDRIIVAAAGNIDHEEFVAQVRDAFWRMMGKSRPVTTELPRYQPGVTLEHMPVSQAYFSLGIRACQYADPNRYGLHVLNNILGGGISSRLFRRIRESRGLVYHISSNYHAYRDDGMLVVEGCAAPENTLQVLGLAFDELTKLISADEPIDEEELWKAKMQIRGQYLIAGENTHTRMNRLASQELYFGRHIPDKDILDQIDAIQTQELQTLAHEILRDAFSHAAIAVVGPQAPDHYQSSSIKRQLDNYQRRSGERR
jgi:predicted Zn-dependent peptidase